MNSKSVSCAAHSIVVCCSVPKCVVMCCKRVAVGAAVCPSVLLRWVAVCIRAVEPMAKMNK